MAMKKCKECGTAVSSKAESCPSCGARLKAKPMGCGSVIGFIILAIIILAAVGSFLGGNGESGSASTATNARTVAATTPKPNHGNASNTAHKNRKPTSQPVSSISNQTAWSVHSFKAEMDGHKIWNATTDEVKAYGQLTWPSNNVTAHLTVGKDHGKIFAVFVFSHAPNLVGGQIQHGYTIYKFPISFDGHKTQLTITQKWGAPDLYVSYPSWFIKKVESSKVVKIRMPWYHQAAMYFKFNVAGLRSAIQKFK